MLAGIQRKTLNVRDAAEYVGLSKSYLDKARITGGGPKYIKLGQRVVYDTKDLDAWLDENRRRSTSDVMAS
jgi:predicted DNA-binding transcriptional regulator AlpA